MIRSSDAVRKYVPRGTSACSVTFHQAVLNAVLHNASYLHRQSINKSRALSSPHIVKATAKSTNDD